MLTKKNPVARAPQHCLQKNIKQHTALSAPHDSYQLCFGWLMAGDDLFAGYLAESGRSPHAVSFHGMPPSAGVARTLGTLQVPQVAQVMGPSLENPSWTVRKRQHRVLAWNTGRRGQDVERRVCASWHPPPGGLHGGRSGAPPRSRRGSPKTVSPSVRRSGRLGEVGFGFRTQDDHVAERGER